MIDWKTIHESVLTEGGLSRYYTAFKEREMVMVSANRQSRSTADNHKAQIALRRDIEALGLGYVQGSGCGQETDSATGQVVASSEPTLLVVNATRGGGKVAEFKSVMMRLADKYEQEWILYGIAGTVQLIGTHQLRPGEDPEKQNWGDVAQEFKNFHAGEAMFYTKLRGGTFHFESVQRVPISGWAHGMSRVKEIINIAEWL